jgi:hypothetical protein
MLMLSPAVNCWAIISRPLRGLAFSHYYYSVVTFTTHGFGDIVPRELWAEVAVTLQVIMGYIMLGGLISIFATKFITKD